MKSGKFNMCFSEKELAEMVYRATLTLLTERVSSRVFHFLPLSSMASIAETNEFLLSQSNTKSDYGNWNGQVDPTKGMSFNGKSISPYYLSLSRTPSSAVGYVRMRRENTKNEWKTALVRLELDGDILNYNFKGRPVNYFRDKYDPKIKHNSMVYSIPKSGDTLIPKKQKRYGTQKDDDLSIRGRRPIGGYIDYNVLDRNQMSEYEDRVLSDKPIIPNASKYIKRVDILLLKRQISDNILSQIAAIKKVFGDRLFIYDNEVAFNSMNVRDSLTTNNRYLPIDINNIDGLNDYKATTGGNKTALSSRDINIIGVALAMLAYINTYALKKGTVEDDVRKNVHFLNLDKYLPEILNAAINDLKRYNKSRVAFLSREVAMNIDNHLKQHLKYLSFNLWKLFSKYVFDFNKQFNQDISPQDKTSIFRVLRKSFQLQTLALK